MNESQKQQVYQKWIERGRPWFDIDPNKEPTYAERQIILEMKKRENNKSKRDIELERSPKNIHEKYGKYGKIPDTIFDSLSNYYNCLLVSAVGGSAGGSSGYYKVCYSNRVKLELGNKRINS